MTIILRALAAATAANRRIAALEMQLAYRLVEPKDR